VRAGGFFFSLREKIGFSKPRVGGNFFFLRGGENFGKIGDFFKRPPPNSLEKGPWEFGVSKKEGLLRERR